MEFETVKRLRILVVLLCIMFITGCIKKQPKIGFYQKLNGTLYEDSITLKSIDTIAFPIDSVTSKTTHSVNSFEINGKVFLSFISTTSKSINVYDYATRKLIKQIKYNVRGTHSIGENSDFIGHYFINLDSVLICNSQTRNLFLVNGDGIVLRVYNLADGESSNITKPSPIVSTDQQMFVENNKAYISTEFGNTEIEDQTTIKAAIILDLKTGKIERSFSRPAVYNIGKWGLNFIMFRTSQTYNPNTKRFVVNFAIDPFLHETDFNNVNISHYVSSKFFKNIGPIDDDFSEDDEKSREYEFTTPWFYNIIYDSYKNLYYRTAFIPLSKIDYQNVNIRYNRPTSIIIMNSSFKKIGEYLVPKSKFTFYNYFVNKYGYHMMLAPNIQKSEDSIYYVRFKPVAKNEN
jgi:hypothetical protein